MVTEAYHRRRETDSLTQGNRIGSHEHVCTAILTDKSTECDRIVGVAQRRRYLSEKKLCFKCTGTRHWVAECRIVRSCQKCGARNHTSICDKGPQQMLLTTGEGAVMYPVVVVIVDDIKCRALLDTGAGSSYASAALVKRLGK